MNLQDFMHLHPKGHDFRLCSEYYGMSKDSGYNLTMWVEWIEDGNARKSNIKTLKNYSVDFNINFELYED